MSARTKHRFQTATVAASVAESIGKRVGNGAAAVNSGVAGPERWAGVRSVKAAIEIPLDRIAPDPDQPRKRFDPTALDRLAWSLKHRGQLQPIRVRWDAAGSRYLILCGERRYRAAVLASLPSLVAIVEDRTLDAGELLAIQLLENCAREDLGPIEQAEAMRALESAGWNQRRIAEETGLSPASVNRGLALLDLPDEVRELVAAGKLAASSAYELSRARGQLKPAELLKFARLAADKEWSRNQLMSKLRTVFHGETRASVGSPVDEACGLLAEVEAECRAETPGVVWNEHELTGGEREVVARWNVDGVEVMVAMPRGVKASPSELIDRAQAVFASRYNPAAAFAPGDKVVVVWPAKQVDGWRATVEGPGGDPGELSVALTHPDGRVESGAWIPARRLRKLGTAVDALASPPDPEGPRDLDAALREAVAMWDAVADKLARLRREGATNRAILAALGGWPGFRRGGEREGWAWGAVGGPAPAFFWGVRATLDRWPDPSRATLQGARLADSVRALCRIPRPERAAKARKEATR